MESHAQLVRRIELFSRGIICPSEMWIPLFEGLWAEDVPAFFNQLKEELRATVLQDYRDFARYRFSQAECERFPMAVQKTILAVNEWCEEHS